MEAAWTFSRELLVPLLIGLVYGPALWGWSYRCLLSFKAALAPAAVLSLDLWRLGLCSYDFELLCLSGFYIGFWSPMKPELLSKLILRRSSYNLDLLGRPPFLRWFARIVSSKSSCSLSSLTTTKWGLSIFLPLMAPSVLLPPCAGVYLWELPGPIS